jgi:hypothetical protein
MAKSPVKSLVEIAKSKIPSPLCNKPKGNFLTRLPAEQREQLIELRAQYRSGELGTAWTPRGLLYEIVEPAGIELGVNFNTWRRWLSEGHHQKEVQ